ncbi:hypothetical protein Ciccas_000371 [Cichlidogyrus casuarinus]|uniref:Uncharacterized protein n=1 Tax=Cichlidogyrus casuarinus TaxID=1844966 RepID=A0ABD2QN65_9PLAT
MWLVLTSPDNLFARQQMETNVATEGEQGLKNATDMLQLIEVHYGDKHWRSLRDTKCCFRACFLRSHYVLTAIFAAALILFCFALVIYSEHRLVHRCLLLPWTLLQDHGSSLSSPAAMISEALRRPQEMTLRIMKQNADRINQIWFLLARHSESSLKHLARAISSRFQHEMDFLREQACTEIKVVLEPFRPHSSVFTFLPPAYSEKCSLKKDTFQTDLNSFDNAVCHYDNISIGWYSDKVDLSSYNKPTTFARRPNPLEYIWAAVLSWPFNTVANFQWTDTGAARRLVVTVFCVIVGMFTAIGCLDLIGWYARSSFFRPKNQKQEITVITSRLPPVILMPERPSNYETYPAESQMTNNEAMLNLAAPQNAFQNHTLESTEVFAPIVYQIHSLPHNSPTILDSPFMGK